MKTIYEKATTVANYLRDIIYMQRYYMDHYEKLATIRMNHGWVTPTSKMERVRSYMFQINNPNTERGAVQHLISVSSDYKSRYVLCLTSSYSHIQNHSNKYCETMFANINVNDIAYGLGPKSQLFVSLKDGIYNKEVQETEFQMLMMYNEYDMMKIYLRILLNEDLLNVQYANKDSVLCISETDYKVYVPVRKAMIDLLGSIAKNDWRKDISERYGHNIG